MRQPISTGFHSLLILKRCKPHAAVEGKEGVLNLTLTSAPVSFVTLGKVLISQLLSFLISYMGILKQILHVVLRIK